MSQPGQEKRRTELTHGQRLVRNGWNNKFADFALLERKQQERGRGEAIHAHKAPQRRMYVFLLRCGPYPFSPGIAL